MRTVSALRLADPAAVDDVCDAAPIRIDGTDVNVRVRVTPKASTAKVAGLVSEVDGRRAIKVMVTAAPEDGKANAAVVTALAKAWGLPKSALSVAVGLKDRRKTIRIRRDSALAAEELGKRLTAWARTLDASSERKGSGSTS